MGPDAYKDVDKFPTGAYCSEKEWVLMGRYAGNRFKVEGLELRLINDDNIIAKYLIQQIFLMYSGGNDE